MSTLPSIRSVALAAMIILAAASSGFAQSSLEPPPASALKLSDIIAKVEKRPGFYYIERIQWFNDSYSVTFHTLDKARVEMNFDAVTGAAK
jgi:hypothetical protein